MDANTPEPALGSVVRDRAGSTWTCHPGETFDVDVPKVWICDATGYSPVRSWPALWEHRGPLEAVAVQHQVS